MTNLYIFILGRKGEDRERERERWIKKIQEMYTSVCLNLLIQIDIIVSAKTEIYLSVLEILKFHIIKASKRILWKVRIAFFLSFSFFIGKFSCTVRRYFRSALPACNCAYTRYNQNAKKKNRLLMRSALYLLQLQSVPACLHGKHLHATIPSRSFILFFRSTVVFINSSRFFKSWMLLHW